MLGVFPPQAVTAKQEVSRIYFFVIIKKLWLGKNQKLCIKSNRTADASQVC